MVRWALLSFLLAISDASHIRTDRSLARRRVPVDCTTGPPVRTSLPAGPCNDAYMELTNASKTTGNDIPTEAQMKTWVGKMCAPECRGAWNQAVNDMLDWGGQCAAEDINRVGKQNTTPDRFAHHFPGVALGCMKDETGNYCAAQDFHDSCNFLSGCCTGELFRTFDLQQGNEMDVMQRICPKSISAFTKSCSNK